MSERLKKLLDLQAELHEVNLELMRAARPLRWLSEMNDEQRCQVADQLRAPQARWDSVTQQILQTLKSGTAPAVLAGPAIEENCTDHDERKLQAAR